MNKKTGEHRECLAKGCKEIIYITKSDIEKTKMGIKSVRTNGKYCSNQCQGDHAWEIKKQIVLEKGVEALNGEGEYCHQGYDRILKQIIIEENPHGKSGRACWKCGWEKQNPFTKKGEKGKRTHRMESNIPTQLNHIDGNPLNNDISNLEILCPNCHYLTEFHGSRGKGGRPRANKR